MMLMDSKTSGLLAHRASSQSGGLLLFTVHAAYSSDWSPVQWTAETISTSGYSASHTRSCATNLCRMPSICQRSPKTFFETLAECLRVFDKREGVSNGHQWTPMETLQRKCCPKSIHKLKKTRAESSLDSNAQSL